MEYPEEEEVESTPEEVFVPSKLLIDIRLSEGQLVQYLPNEEDHSIAERINPLNSYPDKKSYL